MHCRFLPQGIFPTQGWNPHLLHWQALAGGVFTSEPPGKPITVHSRWLIEEWQCSRSRCQASRSFFHSIAPSESVQEKLYILILFQNALLLHMLNFNPSPFASLYIPVKLYFYHVFHWIWGSDRLISSLPLQKIRYYSRVPMTFHWFSNHDMNKELLRPESVIFFL